MKKTFILIALSAVLLTLPLSGAFVGTRSLTASDSWVRTATFSATGAEPTALAVTERTYLTVNAAITANANGDGKIKIIYAPPGATAARFRFLGTTNNNANIYDVLTGCLARDPDDSTKLLNTDCEYSLRGTLTATTGTQASITTDYEMADTLALTASSDAASTSFWTIASPGTGTETVAEALLDVQGDNIIVLVPTTLACDGIVIVKFYP